MVTPIALFLVRAHYDTNCITWPRVGYSVCEWDWLGQLSKFLDPLLLFVLAVVVPSSFLIFFNRRSEESRADLAGFIAAIVVLGVAVVIGIKMLGAIGLDP